MVPVFSDIHFFLGFFFFFDILSSCAALEAHIASLKIAIQLFFFWYCEAWNKLSVEPRCSPQRKAQNFLGLGIMFSFYQRCGYL